MNIVKSKTQEERSIKNYLLGQGSEEERTQIEDRYFRDPEFHERMLAQEDELIHDYLRGALSSSQKSLFQRHFFHSDRRRQKFEFIKNLSQFADERYMPLTVPVAPRRSLWARLLGEDRAGINRYWIALPAMAAAAAVLIVAISYYPGANPPAANPNDLAKGEIPTVVADPRGSMESASPVPTAEQQAKPAPSAERPESREPARSSILASIPAFILTGPGIRSDDASQLLHFSPQVTHIQLEIPLETSKTSSVSYRASIRTMEGGQVLPMTNVRQRKTAQGVSLVLTVETDLLPDGDYVLHLFSVPSTGEARQIHESFFQVNRR